MHAIDLSFGLSIVLFTIALLWWFRRPSLQLSGVRSQTMCRSCGLITPRVNARCLECGKLLTIQ